MHVSRISGLAIGWLVFVPGAAADAASLVNLAPRAEVSASSEYSADYAARWAVDGRIPPALSKHDARQAWCVRGAEVGDRGELVLTWPTPVVVAEVVYFGRTGQILEECFRDYEVYVDDVERPVASGALAKRHGAQRIAVPRRRIRSLRLAFLSAHPGAHNAGASEIAVFGASPTEEQIREMTVPPEERTPGSTTLRADLLSGRLGFGDLLVVKRYPMNISHVYVYHVEGFQKGGGLYVYSPGSDEGAFRCLVDSSDGMISTADLSYDGKEVVFAWKRGGLVRCNPVAHIEDIDRSVSDHNYQIYRIGIDGTGLTQLTDGPHNNLDPCWLPDGGIAFISDRRPAYAYCYVVTSPVVHRMERDGSRQRRLSANYLMDFTPSVLSDGRIIYTRWEYVDRAACPIQSLWTIRPDGTGLSGYYGNRVLSPGTFMDAQPVPGTNAILATATNHNGPCRGGIVLIDPGRGANARDAVTNLTPEIDIYAHRMGAGPFGNGMLGCGIRGGFEKPFPIDARRYLVTDHGRLQVRDFDGHVATLLHPAEGMGYYCAQPVRSEPLPPVLGTAADHPRPDGAEDASPGPWATVILHDVHHGLEPHVRRGEVRRIAVVQEIEKSTHSPQNNLAPDGSGMRNIAVFGFQFPLVSCGATYAPKKLWGFADVREDGSAAFRVPAEVPIYFMALDGEGRAVQRMRSFTHLMPGEVQSCVGCHADRGAAAARGGTSPPPGTPQDLEPPSWGVDGFSYPAVVQPVLDRHCTSCHNEREQPGGVDLTGDRTDFFSVSYDVLCRTGTQGERNWARHGSPSGPDHDHVRGMSPYTEWIWTINGAGHNVLEIEPRRWGSPASRLAEIIRTGHPDGDGVPRVEVPDADRRRVYAWLDLNVPYYGTSSSNHKRRLGSRRMYPDRLDETLGEVASRRCRSCHPSELPRKFYTRMLRPESNSFLLAPLAADAGGTQRCGKAVFASPDDPDYRRIVETFRPIRELLRERPRADMPGFAVASGSGTDR